MGLFRDKQVVTQKKSDEPYATIVGYGRWGYRVRVTTPGNYYLDYEHYFLFGKERAERYAKRKLDIAMQKYSHKRYSKTYTISGD